MTTSSVIRCGSGGFWAASRKPSIASVHLLIRPVEQVLAGVHDVVRVKSTFDLLHHLEAASQLEREKVDVSLPRHAVGGTHGSPVPERRLGDLTFAGHPGGPRLFVELLLPNTDVDLGDKISPGLVRSI